ncbi:PAS domain S-box-containing protein [Bryocella elongata]|uniref:histidine kinase n=1 Tax=Bryocella elongata TaxID=863522 RepID=A0A1H5UW85_9BACT|nr:PAS domain-containing protein [Bryocella elongata]SEF79273.1 PAS domain S-box-containing protein [Bryocella elongata]
MRRESHAGTSLDFGSVVDALPALIWMTHADGQSSFANRAWSEYTGLAIEETVGLGWQTAIHPDDVALFMQTWDSIRRSGVPNEIDARLRRFDGQHRWFVFRPSPLPEDDLLHQRWCWLGSDADERTATDGRLRRLFDMVPLQAGFLNTAGVLEFTNLQSLKDFDMTFEELKQWTTSGIIHVDDHQNNLENMTALLTTGEMFDSQIRMLYPDGVYRWTRAKCVPVRDAQGNVVRYVTFQIDVDDLKRAEDLLAAEVRLLERVARSEPLGQILDALSRHVEELCVGCFCIVLVVAADRKRFHLGAAPKLPNVFRDSLEAISIDRREDPCSLAVIEKTPVITTDLTQDPRWTDCPWLRVMTGLDFDSCCALPIQSASGEVSGVVAAHRSGHATRVLQEADLVDRFTKIAGIAIDRAESDAVLQARERELREALVQLSEGQRLSKTGSFTADLQQDRHNWSAELYHIFEIDPGTPAHLDVIRAQVHPDDLQLFDAETHRRLEGSGSDFNFRILTAEGNEKHLRGVAQIIEHIGGRPILMGAVQDITQSKQAEEALNRTRGELAHVARVATLNAMTASIAHEVSQPLSGILTNANTCVRMLAATPPNLPGAAETARRAIRDANRATDVIQRLRALFSTKPPVMEIADLNDVAREVIALSLGELRRNGAILQTEFADELPPVSIDRVQLQQVILNLLLNAADAMAGVDDRPRALLVRTALHDADSVKLLVKDSGIGVDPDTVEKLFGAFYTTKAKGMGVGLSISRSIIARHDGRLWAEANQDRGATFAFCIPRAAL